MKFFERVLKHRNIILYGVIGVSAMLVDLGFYLLFFNIFNISPIVSTMLSVTIAMFYAFSLNAVFNFKTKDFIKARFFSYAAVSGLGLLMSAMIIQVLVSIGCDPNIAKVLSLPPIVILQYFINKSVTFKKMN